MYVKGASPFELQALVAPRGKKILAICFLGLEYFSQRFNRPFDKDAKNKVLTLFWTPRGTFWPKKGVIGPGEFLAQMFP